MGKVAMKGFDILSKPIQKSNCIGRNEVKEANMADICVRYDTVSFSN